MRLLDRHIGIHVLWAILIVLVAILGLALLFSFVDEMNDIDQNYSVLSALTYVALTIPQRLFELLPMAALIGCLIGLGTLASQSELTVMRAAGVSLKRIVWAILKPLLILMLLGLIVSEYIAPITENMAQSGRAIAQGKGEAQSAKRGLWHRDGTDFIHLNAVQPNGDLIGVTRYHFNDQQELLFTSFAKAAAFRDGRWELTDIATTYFEGNHTSVVHRQSELWETELNPDLASISVLDPATLSLSGLWKYIHYLTIQKLNSAAYWLAFWSKLLKPLATVALVLMAISFIFGPLRSVTMGQRIFTGVLVGFVFQIIQDLLGPSSLVFGFPPLLAVLLPICVCLLIGGWLLKRAG